MGDSIGDSQKAGCPGSADADQTKLYCVVEYWFADNLYITTVPSNWLLRGNGHDFKLYSPKSYSRTIMKQRKSPDPKTWQIIEDVKIRGEYETYKEAIFNETKMVESSESESVVDAPKTKKRQSKPNKKYRDDVLSPPPSLKRNSKANTIYDSDSEESVMYDASDSDYDDKTLTSESHSTTENVRKQQSQEVFLAENSTEASSNLLYDKRRQDEISKCLDSNQERTRPREPLITNVSVISDPIPIGSDRSTPTSETAYVQSELIDIKARMISMESKLDRIMERIAVSIPPRQLNLLPEFPLRTLGEYRECETNLKENEEYKQQFITFVQRIGGNNIENSTKNILKRIFSDFVGSFLSWKGLKGNIAVKETAIMANIKEALLIAYPSTFTEEKLKEYTMVFFQYASVRLNRERDKGRKHAQ